MAEGRPLADREPSRRCRRASGLRYAILSVFGSAIQEIEVNVTRLRVAEPAMFVGDADDLADVADGDLQIDRVPVVVVGGEARVHAAGERVDLDDAALRH